ncbi:MAG: hypothetical protein AB7O26_00030 [Planctomycetaceae bacterium]
MQPQLCSQQVGAGAQHDGAAGAQHEGAAGAAQVGAAGAQHEGAAGAAQVGAGAQQEGAGAQQDGAGAQHEGSGAQQLFSQQLFLWRQPNRPASAEFTVALHRTSAAVKESHFISILLVDVDSGGRT